MELMTLLEIIGCGLIAYILIWLIVIWPLLRTAAKSDEQSEGFWRAEQQKRWRARKRKK